MIKTKTNKLKIRTSSTNPRPSHLLTLLLASLLVLGTLVSCGSDAGTDAGSRSDASSYDPVRQTVFLEADGGGYYMAEAVYPDGLEGGAPLVAIAHGFKGTLNSGGASELAGRLAEAGIASIRMDFNPRVTASKKAEKTNTYDLASMREAMLSGIEYMCEHYEIAEDQIGLYARSMGGRVVMNMANENAGGYDFTALAMVAPAGNDGAMIYYVGGQEKWDEMKAEAAAQGSIEFQGLNLTEDWFTEFEEYNPCDYGGKFGDRPVLVVANTLDHVVTEATSLECAAAYASSRVLTVTTDDGHGYEMSYDDSDLKDEIMTEIVTFFVQSFADN